MRRAFDFFNKALFDGRVSTPFVGKSKLIASTARGICGIGGKLILLEEFDGSRYWCAALVHEMCHSLDFLSFHGRGWQESMLRVGLETFKVDNGWSHRVIEGGPFDRAYDIYSSGGDATLVVENPPGRGIGLFSVIAILALATLAAQAFSSGGGARERRYGYAPQDRYGSAAERNRAYGDRERRPSRRERRRYYDEEE